MKYFDRNTKTLSTQQDKSHNNWHPFRSYQACQKARKRDPQ